MGELQRRITYTEFLEWMLFLRREDERDMKSEYYQAQIAAQICKGQVENPKKVHTSDFLISIVDPEEAPKKSEGTKRVWASLLNIKLEDN